MYVDARQGITEWIGSSRLAKFMEQRFGDPVVEKLRGIRVTQLHGGALLSVGSKLLVRVMTDRTQRWSEAWLHAAQAGLRKSWMLFCRSLGE